MKICNINITMTVVAAVVFGGVLVTQAQVVYETVPIGNPGNPGEPSAGVLTGGVDYTYSMGKFEVTAGQYTVFLNAVAATDRHSLYDTRMDFDADPSFNGCNIKRQGTSGNFTYSVAPDWANRPVNWINWASAVRFANWLHNGQPTGAQDLTTTEDGSYFINDRFDAVLDDVLREPDATWVIPTDDEWYKAAFHKNDGVTGNYWNYGTGSDSFPDNDLIDPDPGNHATYHTGFFGDPEGYTIGAPYYRTEGGAHENSSSAYGTFDQAGNMMEFTETVPEPDIRRMRDGSWKLDSSLMGANQIDDVMHSSDQFDTLGFRLANVGSTDCGNGTCDPGENPITCPQDCPDVCGDGLCTGSEDAQNCPADCAECTVNGDCDDGLFCNGIETCVNGVCVPGSDPCPGLFCDETLDQCVECLSDADCDDGNVCNGIETCVNGVCQPGIPLDCDDGLFCNGVETCDPVSGCQNGVDPCGGGECDEDTDTCIGGGAEVLWMSFKNDTVVPGVGTVADEDVVTYNINTGTWTLQFDGSDVGLGGLEIDGLAMLPNGDLLMSFTAAGSVPGLAGGPSGTSVDDSDIVQFSPTSLGSSTSGAFTFYFDGSDIGLSSSSEDIDGIGLDLDGSLIVTTTGNFSGSGAGGADEDLFVFNATSLGSSTAGSFSLIFDGSDVGLTSSGEDIDSVTRTQAGDFLYSTTGSFSVTGVNGADEDVLFFVPSQLGGATSGSFSMFLDLSAEGITSDVGSLFLAE